MDPITKGKLDALVARVGKKMSIELMAQAFIVLHQNDVVYCTSWGQFLAFDGRLYRRLEKRDMLRMISAFLAKYFPALERAITPTTWNSIYDHLIVSFPVAKEDTQLPQNIFAFEDTLLDTETWQELPFTSEILCYKAINCKLADASKPAPTLDNYLKTTIVNSQGEHDPQLLMAYQEMVGSLFSGQTASNRAFFLFGAGANGKSMTTELILSLFEEQYVASASLETLSQRFGKSRLVGKIVNICSEEESQFIRHDVFKALVTGEQIDAERKNEPGFCYHNFAKLIFATNNFPKFSGLDHSARRRIITIPFNRIFEPHERDYSLLDKLKQEKAQFVGFALEGLKRLQANNFQYSQSLESDNAMASLMEESSNAVRFINSRFEIDLASQDQGFTAMQLHAKYLEWCSRTRHRPMTEHKFAKQLAQMESLKEARFVRNNQRYYALRELGDDLPPTVQGQRPPQMPLPYAEENLILPPFND